MKGNHAARHHAATKTGRIARKTCRKRNQAQADVLDYIERFFNPTRRHSTLGYLSPSSSKGRRL